MFCFFYSRKKCYYHLFPSLRFTSFPTFPLSTRRISLVTYSTHHWKFWGWHPHGKIRFSFTPPTWQVFWLNLYLCNPLLFLVLEKLTTLIEDKNMSRNIAWVWLRTHSKSGNSSSLDNLTGSLLSRIHILWKTKKSLWHYLERHKVGIILRRTADGCSYWLFDNLSGNHRCLKSSNHLT